jgi:hypothetical protein
MSSADGRVPKRPRLEPVSADCAPYDADADADLKRRHYGAH